MRLLAAVTTGPVENWLMITTSMPSSGPASTGGTTRPFGGNDVPFPSDDEFDPDDEDMTVSTTTELTGMALVQRELGGQIIGEFED